ncbi:hypothetical protein LAV_00211 [Sphingobium phage Lacusarx]|uniref:Uncharacterized protein n=1 Tax=Sphingobium phage Lacusarx TaxID=1980139 RepID=A0A1W6DXK0_9CAUD|nr:hypothetical protein FDH44_gp092 [Sphingobium phage Lacusarx]ARK07586.1 hypothetical protein LAV_00211 [Sphingobium phage Lacusarx]
MTKKAEKAAQAAEAIATLRKLIKPGQKVYCQLQGKPSSSGMSRTINLLIVAPVYDLTYPLKPAEIAKYPGERDYEAKPVKKLRGHEIRPIGYTASIAMGRTWDSDKQGIRIGGCGMDMGFSLVYDLGNTLWPKGTRKPHGTLNGKPDKSGGYALKHEWL